MAFTDKYLAALKESSERLFCKGPDCANITLSLAELDSLIARLEAAEEFVNPNPRCSCGQLCDSCADAYAKWRTEAGKK